MTERPILFKGPLVRAILDGTKTVTRRIVKPQPDSRTVAMSLANTTDWVPDYAPEVEEARPGWRCAYGVAGDRLWVRETWAKVLMERFGPPQESVVYRAEGEPIGGCRWCPSIFMPRWASRLTLEVVAVRVERLQEITEADAKAEGAFGFSDDVMQQAARVGLSEGAKSVGARDYFRVVWDQINHKRGPWASNPWVWRIEFRKALKP